MKKFRKYALLVSLLSFILILSAFAYAEEYYADLNVVVQNDGSVKISGITNDPALTPGTYQEFTSKKGTYWLLNISSGDAFSDYILTVTLPDGAEFNYLKTDGRSRVSYDNGIKIIASGSGSLNLLVQYHINSSKQSFFSLRNIIIALIIIGILAAGVFIQRKYYGKNSAKKAAAKNIMKRSSEKRKRKSEKNDGKSRNEKESNEKDDYEKIRIIKKTLSESQEKIVDLLLDAKGELVQKQLQHRSGLAKATLSRNIDTLAKKGIIIKQSRGMTNMIKLNKELDK